MAAIPSRYAMAAKGIAAMAAPTGTSKSPEALRCKNS